MSTTSYSKQLVESLLTNWENRQSCTDHQIQTQLQLLSETKQKCLDQIQHDTDMLIKMLQERARVLTSELQEKSEEKRIELEDLLKEKTELKKLLKIHDSASSNDVDVAIEEVVDESVLKKVQDFTQSKLVENLENYHKFSVPSLDATLFSDLLLNKFGKLTIPAACIKTRISSPTLSSNNGVITTSSAPSIVTSLERRPRNASFMRLPVNNQPSTSTTNSSSSKRMSVTAALSPLASSSPRTSLSSPTGSGNGAGFSQTVLRFEDKIKESYERMRQSPEISFITMEYDEKDQKFLKFSKDGAKIDELLQEMTPEKSLHAIVKVGAIEFDDVKRDKYVGVTFIGEKTKLLRRGAITANINVVMAQYGLTVCVHVKDVDSVKKDILEKLQASAGMNRPREYSFYN
ncbi:hypothetical protein FDP41_005638 [Naegleria fowleri]|uniref:ADF-H domain-containing protein n=1 Tax=Naegleria fowleri TaxID=5763 RepID=A0A6A5BNI2_NAEFO|nr:uncharacterized protein FDP41_005638 [Naegleria fowleri]KAF0975644.1 hypothetical protein FDP41_005638 [Naegleria fowleri]CAG4719423.1 unnamed protein product [Naegleria fowleri]